ncbi:unnamed protein product [Phytomonas sp. EM1]|nr:unnamed protein product [Phytomonas sp. EM1]|eukprot:CCW65520.1 unnamed protein product [Phytomonas sp. isolate EM1]
MQNVTHPMGRAPRPDASPSPSSAISPSATIPSLLSSPPDTDVLKGDPPKTHPVVPSEWISGEKGGPPILPTSLFVTSPSSYATSVGSQGVLWAVTHQGAPTEGAVHRSRRVAGSESGSGPVWTHAETPSHGAGTGTPFDGSSWGLPEELSRSLRHMEPSTEGSQGATPVKNRAALEAAAEMLSSSK